MTDQNLTELENQVRDWLKGFPPEAPAVAVPVFNAYDDVLECVNSLLTCTPADTPILVLDDASTDERIGSTLEPLSRSRGFAYVRKPSNTGFGSTLNLAFAWCAPRDVVITNSDIIVPPGWLERLQAAAYFRSTIATATPLTNHGTLLSVPYRNHPVDSLVGGLTTDQVDARIRGSSLLLRPIIPTAIGHCIYFRRSAFDIVGYFDEVFAPGYGEEVDFSQRAVIAGFSNVAADDLFVFHKGSRSFGSQGQESKLRIQAAHEGILNARYPWYRPWKDEASNDPSSPLALALERARAALLSYRIAIDATRVDGMTTGTQVLILELIRALATAPSRCAHLTVIIGDGVPERALLGVDRLVDKVIRVSDLQDLERPLFDLIHRPFQVVSTQDLELLQRLASRTVITQLDFISFSNPSYAENQVEWARYRHLTQLAFAAADGIAFISHDAAQDAAHHGLHIPAERACVTYAGVDHQLHSADASPPAESARLKERPFVLMVGTNFKHKNRPYALKLFGVLVQKYQWPGQLVFAGPPVAHGGSVAEETQILQGNPDLASRVLDLGAVDETHKRWLLENAALVLYPSSYEGFGIVPFEAAVAGTPPLTTRVSSLGEILGDQVIYLENFDPEAGAETAWSLLSDPEMARRQVEAAKAGSAMFTWSAVADRTWDFYRRILKMPPRPRELRPWEQSQARPVEEGPLEAWPRRMGLAFHILRAKGPGALIGEVRQFIRWLVAH